MAVCGHCWICGGKFDCSELRSCSERCRGEPLTVGRDGSLRNTKICGECERDVDSGAVQGLMFALRAVRDAAATK